MKWYLPILYSSFCLINNPSAYQWLVSGVLLDICIYHLESHHQWIFPSSNFCHKAQGFQDQWLLLIEFGVCFCGFLIYLSLILLVSLQLISWGKCTAWLRHREGKSTMHLLKLCICCKAPFHLGDMSDSQRMEGLIIPIVQHCLLGFSDFCIYH